MLAFWKSISASSIDEILEIYECLTVGNIIIADISKNVIAGISETCCCCHSAKNIIVSISEIIISSMRKITLARISGKDSC